MQQLAQQQNVFQQQQQHQQQQLQHQQQSRNQSSSLNAPSYYNSNSNTQLQQQQTKRKRRHRTIFSEEQLDQLESTFSKTHYPDVVLREDLANKIDLKEERVEVLFNLIFLSYQNNNKKLVRIYY